MSFLHSQVNCNDFTPGDVMRSAFVAWHFAHRLLHREEKAGCTAYKFLFRQMQNSGLQVSHGEAPACLDRSNMLDSVVVHSCMGVVASNLCRYANLHVSFKAGTVCQSFRFFDPEDYPGLEQANYMPLA